MDEIEKKVLETIETLKPQSSQQRVREWMLTAALAAVGALAFFYALQSTRPIDVLRQVQPLQLEVDLLRRELIEGTRPADVLQRVNEVQAELLTVQSIVLKLTEELKVKSSRDRE